jgi:chloride channel 3/4/5
MRKDLTVLHATGMTVADVGAYRLHDCIRFPHLALAEGRLASAPYKGFPVVAADGTNLLLGYIERTELRWVIGTSLSSSLWGLLCSTRTDKARKVRDVPRTTPCTFVAPASGAHAHGDFADGELADSELEDGLLTPDVDGSFLSDGPAPAIGMSERVATRLLEGGADALALWPWVNTAPLTVGPRLPLEVAMQLFKRMGYVLPTVQHACS